MNVSHFLFGYHHHSNDCRGVRQTHQLFTVAEMCSNLLFHVLRHHSAVGLVDRLVKEKLAVRIRSAEDRRQVLIELTSRGEKTLATLAALHRGQLQRIGPEISRLLDRLNKIG
jgi:hypothetical protein